LEVNVALFRVKNRKLSAAGREAGRATSATRANFRVKAGDFMGGFGVGVRI
jgi:hypothetical protein